MFIVIVVSLSPELSIHKTTMAKFFLRNLWIMCKSGDIIKKNSDFCCGGGCSNESFKLKEQGSFCYAELKG
jgi:hypothetical protein